MKPFHSSNRSEFLGYTSAFWLAIALSSIDAQGATNQASLIGYWPLHGNAVAAVGLSGELVGQPTAASDHLGNPSGALQFDGARHQHVRIPGGGGLDGRSEGTISLWVRWNSHAQPAGASQAVFGAVLG